MRIPIRLLMILAAGALPLSVYAEPRFVTLLSALPLSHSTAEAVELLVVLRPVPPHEEGATITLRLALLDADPYVANVHQSQFTLPGLGKLKLTTRSVQADGETCLVVSAGQQEGELCGVRVEDGRVAYEVSLEGAATRSPPWGGEIPITVAQGPIAVAISDRENGKTVSTFLINGIKLQGQIDVFH